MEIQRGKEGMKMQQFNSQVGATAGCTLRALLGTIPPDEKDKRFGIRGDAWFGSVRAANEVALRGQEAVFQIKTYHASFPKDFIVAALKDAPGGVYVALEGVTKDEIELVAIGYRYSRKTTLHFVATKNAGSTALGDPYHMKYTDTYGNVCTRYVDRPQIVSNFFGSSNAIDTHNQLRQDCIRLEKKWITRDPYFRLATTMIAINVTDAYLLANFHKVINYSPTSDDDETEKIGIKRFAGILAFQLIEMGKKLASGPLKFLEEDVIEVKVPILIDGKTDFSSPTFQESSTEVKTLIRSLSDANGKKHCLVKYEVTKDPSGRQRTKMRKCKLCFTKNKKRRDVGQYCFTCGESMSLCNDSGRDCFRDHVMEIKRITRHSAKNSTLP
jgi:hypothetical protein